MAVLPLLLYRVIGPKSATPDAPAAAERRSRRSVRSRATNGSSLVMFVGMVALWATAATFGLDSTAIAFLGLGVLLATGVITLGDIAAQGDVLATFIWFAVLFTLSSQLNDLGFMAFVGSKLAERAGRARVADGRVDSGRGVRPPSLPVREPDGATVGALRRVPGCRRQARRYPALLAFQLLFATNYFSGLTPQGSSANLLFAGSGYFSSADLYRLGAITTGVSVLIYFSSARRGCGWSSGELNLSHDSHNHGRTRKRRREVI